MYLVQGRAFFSFFVLCFPSQVYLMQEIATGYMPGRVVLTILYWQKSTTEKEVVSAGLWLEEMFYPDTDQQNGKAIINYTFEFSAFPMTHAEV